MGYFLAQRKSYYRVTGGNKQEQWFSSFIKALRLFKQWADELGVAELHKEIMIDYKRYVEHFKSILLYQVKPKRG